MIKHTHKAKQTNKTKKDKQTKKATQNWITVHYHASPQLMKGRLVRRFREMRWGRGNFSVTPRLSTVYLRLERVKFFAVQLDHKTRITEKKKGGEWREGKGEEGWEETER